MDAVSWITGTRVVAGRELDAADDPTDRHLFVTSLVLLGCLFACLARLWWLADRPDSTRASDAFAVPLALTCLLLLLFSTIGWDRVHRDKLAAVRRRSLRQMTATRLLGEQRLAAILSGTSDLVLILTGDLVIAYCSEASQTMLGRSAAYLRGRHLNVVVEPDDVTALLEATVDLGDDEQRRLHVRARRVGGDVVQVEAVIGRHHEDELIGGYLVTLHDIAERTALAEHLATQALIDPLTSLPNRQFFASMVTQSLRGAGDLNTVVILLNLVDFKGQNTRLGHDGGDRLLVAVADRLQQLAPGELVVARLAADEFGLLGRLDDQQTTEMVARICTHVATPVVVDGHPVQLYARLGLADSEHVPGSAEQLLQCAEVALTVGREADRTVTRYDPATHRPSVDKLAIRRDLERALDEGQLHVEFQPIVEIGTGRLRAVEALARWSHPVRGAVSPDIFVPVAEATGLMGRLGGWVIDEVCAAAARILEVQPDVRVAVNISAVQVSQPDFVTDLLQATRAHRLSPRALILEITETSLVVALDAVVSVLQALRELGFRVSVDDFGTGYSSLAYLARLPLDEMKIDRSFVERLPWDAQTVSVVRGMLGMCDDLGLVAVAEGVESSEQATWLAEAGCRLGQGYAYTAPMSERELHAWLAQLEQVPPQSRRNLSA